MVDLVVSLLQLIGLIAHGTSICTYRGLKGPLTKMKDSLSISRLATHAGGKSLVIRQMNVLQVCLHKPALEEKVK